MRVNPNNDMIGGYAGVMLDGRAVHRALQAAVAAGLRHPHRPVPVRLRRAVPRDPPHARRQPVGPPLRPALAGARRPPSRRPTTSRPAAAGAPPTRPATRQSGTAAGWIELQGPPLRGDAGRGGPAVTTRGACTSSARRWRRRRDGFARASSRRCAGRCGSGRCSPPPGSAASTACTRPRTASQVEMNDTFGTPFEGASAPRAPTATPISSWRPSTRSTFLPGTRVMTSADRRAHRRRRRRLAPAPRVRGAALVAAHHRLRRRQLEATAARWPRTRAPTTS